MTKHIPQERVTADAGAIALDVRNLAVAYGSGDKAFQALKNVCFNVARGEFVTMVGPSGCGKTTLLKVLSGLRAATSGEVRVDGQLVFGPPPGLAMVFQEYTRSLLPWLSVLGNVTFPLNAKGMPKPEQIERGRSALHSVGLDGFEQNYPWQLSGGMQQRVAIARAIAYRPVVLLLDEPFAAVDAQTRSELEDLILRVQAESKLTCLFVTHDIDESVYLGTRILVLSKRPTVVRESIDVALPYPRDQVESKANPLFVELRTRVLQGIRDEQNLAVGRTG